MGHCPSSCGEVTLKGNPKADCITSFRRRVLSRFLFYPCSYQLPDPLDNSSILPLFDTGVIVASSELSNVTLADPDIEQVLISDCRRPIDLIVGRNITAEDRIAIQVTSGSPPVVNKYFDYDFWQDKIDHQFVTNVMLAFCDGDVINPLDENGRPLQATINAFINYQKPAATGTAWIEFKSITLSFDGDPLSLRNKPVANLIEAGVIL